MVDARARCAGAFADDAVVMCETREQAEAALARLTALLADLGLEPKAVKTRIVHLAEGEDGFAFLGFHHRLVRGWTPRSAHLTFLARWPARKAVQRARDRIRELTGRRWLWMPVEDIVRDLNMFLRGWAGYFRYGNSARASARSGISLSCGWRSGCRSKVTGAERGDGASNRCCCLRTSWA